MSYARRTYVVCACALVAAVFAPAPAWGQADSLPADSALARSTGPVSRTTIRGGTLRGLFGDDPQQALGLVPGVVVRGTETGLAGASTISIRGGMPGGASVYIDGAPVRMLTLGTAGIGLGLASVGDVSVTTGPPDPGFPDMGSGVIGYVARTGGPRLAGSFQAVTDEVLPGAGLSRFDGSLGGPLPGMGGATFIVGGTLLGQRSHFVGLGSDNVPAFLPAGVDTVTGTDTLLGFSDRRGIDWGTDFRGHAKLQITTPSAGFISITGVANEAQERFFPGTFALTPTLYAGSRVAGRLLVANWRQPLGGAFTFRVNVSVGSNRMAAGLLDPGSEALSRDPGLGISLETLRFAGNDSIPALLTDQILRNIRTASGTRVPFLNHDSLRNTQTSRANPYAVSQYWPEQGSQGSLVTRSEQRTAGRWALDWDIANGHRATIGGDVQRADVSSYAADLISMTGLDAYRAEPSRTGFYVTDRFGRGDLRAEVAVRYDHFGGVGLFANTPGRIYTHPGFNRVASITDDTAYASSLARVMTPGRAHNGVSFRTGVEHDLGARTTVRAAFGRWVEPPSLNVILHNTNADLDFTNTLALFGRDVDYGYASLAEVGVRHPLASTLLADAVIYRRTRAFYGGRIQSYADPMNPGDVVNINVLTKLDDVVDLGLDVALDWRSAAWLTARVAYSLRQMDVSALVAGSVTPIDDPTFLTHSLTAAAVARPTRGPLAGFEGSALLRLTSGTWYNRSFALPGEITTPFDTFGPGENANLPWTKRLDLRITRTLTVGSIEWAFVAEARNLFAWQNIIARFAETGRVYNDQLRNDVVSAESSSLDAEAAGNGALSGGTVMLPADCSSWVGFSTSGPVNCVALKRAEARFGNGDGQYTQLERATALSTFYNAFYGPQNFYGAGRSARLGVEIRW